MKRRKFIASGLAATTIALSGCAIFQDNRLQDVSAGQSLETPTYGIGDVSVEVFTDFECGGCATFNETVRPQLFESYINDSEDDIITYKHRDYPVPIGSESKAAALSCRAIQDEYGIDEFWEYKNKVLETQNELSERHLENLAVDMGYDVGVVSSAIDERKYDNVIAYDYQEAEEIGVSHTPYVLVNGESIEDPLDIAMITEKITSLS